MTAIFLAQASFVAVLLLWLSVVRPPSKLWAGLVIGAAALALLGAGAVFIWVYPPLWAFVLIAGGGFVALAFRTWRRVDASAARGAIQSAVRIGGLLVWIIIGGVLVWHGASGRLNPHGETLNLAAPLEGEGYCAVSAGASPLLNFHMETLAPGKQAYRGQSYGVDFIALSPLGLRTRPAYGLLPAPRDPSAYLVFGAEVQAPCAGEVMATHDGMADQPAGEADRSLMAGNHVILRCEGHDVLLAHLRQGSVAISPGQRVEIGARLGEVGNTGASDEPHLHVSAQRAVDPQPAFNGEPVQLTFNGRFLARGACLAATPP